LAVDVIVHVVGSSTGVKISPFRLTPGRLNWGASWESVTMAKPRQQKKPDHLKRVLAALDAGDAAKIREILSDLHPADIANILEGLPVEPRKNRVREQFPLIFQLANIFSLSYP
jgi:hypothetical protein